MTKNRVLAIELPLVSKIIKNERILAKVAKFCLLKGALAYLEFQKMFVPEAFLPLIHHSKVQVLAKSNMKLDFE